MSLSHLSGGTSARQVAVHACGCPRAQGGDRLDRQAVARGDWVALEAYGDLNGTLRRMRDLSAAVTGRPAIASGQIWRSMQGTDMIEPRHTRASGMSS